MDPRIALRISVTGRVQGVWFRAWTQQQARALGVVGWVRNCEDGSVEAHVQGETGAVHQLIDKMRRGPSGARVDDLRSEEATSEELSGFEVRD